MIEIHYVLGFQEQSYLVHKTPSQDWVIFQCLNCQKETHAVQFTMGERRILLNSGLQVVLQGVNIQPLFHVACDELNKLN